MAIIVLFDVADTEHERVSGTEMTPWSRGECKTLALFLLPINETGRSGVDRRSLVLSMGFRRDTHSPQTDAGRGRSFYRSYASIETVFPILHFRH